jgi:hypothetical protein
MQFKFNWQGVEKGVQGALFFDLILLGISCFSTSKEVTLYVYLLAWVITIQDERPMKWWSKVRQEINWLHWCCGGYPENK